MVDSRALSSVSLPTWDVVYVDATGSTNAAAAATPVPGRVVVTDHQTAGRGRLDRGWETPAGVALTFSAVIDPELPDAQWPWLPLLAGVAVADAVRRATALVTSLKWPNDVLVGDRKLAGILVERVAGPAGPVAVVGVGVNVHQTELPVPHATSLALEGATLDRADLLQAVLAGIAGELAGWRSSRGDPTGLRASYRAQCETLGRDVRVERPGGGAVEGRAEDVDDAGPAGGPRGGRRDLCAERRGRGPPPRGQPARRVVLNDMMCRWRSPSRLLNEGESVVFSTRTHAKALLLPLLILVVALGLAAWLTSVTDGIFVNGGWVVAGLLILVFAVWPFLNWLASTYTVTTRRLITRHGVFTRTGHDIPLNRISDVSYERDLVDRMLGCGTLVVSDASEVGRVELPDVPRVERLQLKISELLYNMHNARSDDGT